MSERKHLKMPGWAAALLLAACAGTEPPQSYDFDATGFDGLTSQKFPVLMAGDCSIDGAGDMALTVRDAEVLYVFRRVTDGKIVANALRNPATDECSTTVTPTRKIIITGSGGANKVLLDFLNGTFAPGVKGPPAEPGITIDLLGGTDSVTIRGTPAVDNWALGSDVATLPVGFSSVDLNADKVPDVKLVGVETVTLSTGLGNDVINGMGIVGSDAPHPLGIPMNAFGGDGNDTFTSGQEGLAAANVLNGGDGDDLFLQQNNKASDQLVGGGGRDTADYKIRPATRGMPAVAAPLTITIGAGANDGESGENDDVGADVEIVLGGAADDSITAPAVSGAVATTTAAMGVPAGTHYRLVGNAGNDTLVGSDENDFLDGGVGDDVLRGRGGDDTMLGGAGIDLVDYSTHTLAVVVYMDGSDPMAAMQNGAAGEKDVFNKTAVDIENLRGSPQADTLHGNGGNNIIWGGAENDTINGNGGHDTLYGEAGNDIINGGDGNDVLVGGAGNDTLNGNAGDDLVDALDAATMDTVTCGDGDDAAVVDNNSELVPVVHACERVP